MNTAEALAEGRLGFFWADDEWPPSFDDSAVERGWVRLDGNRVALQVLDESDGYEHFFSDDEPDHPSGIVGVLADDAVLLLGVGRRRGTRVFGSERGSSARFAAAAAVGQIEPSDLASPGLTEAAISLRGVNEWAGATAVEESHTLDDERRRIKDWSIRAASGSTRTAALDSRELRVDADWKVSQMTGDSVVSSPITITCAARRPRDLYDLAEPLIHIQDLVSLAYGGLIVADTGGCRPHLRSGVEAIRTPSFWLAQAHGRPHHDVPEPDFKRHPLFTVADIGGVAGLSRWVKLCTNHYSVVAPTIQHLRIGNPTPQGLMKDVAAGIEHWVKLHRPAKWTVGTRWMDSMRTRLDDNDFNDWCGDSAAWAKDFWDTYNSLKHDPHFQWDHQEVSDLAVSGRLFLTAVLLNRVAGSHAPGRRLFDHPRSGNLGVRLQHKYRS